MKKLLFILLVMACYETSPAQKVNTDSLVNELKLAKEDTSKVNLLSTLSSACVFTDPEKGLEYSGNGIRLAEKLGYIQGKSECLYERGLIYYYKGEYDKSLENYLASLTLLEQLYENKSFHTDAVKKAIADDQHDIGKVYYRQHSFENALQSFNSALVKYRELNYKSGIAGCYNNMAGVYDGMKDFDKTLFYLKEFLKIAEEMGSKNKIATAINNIGLTYKTKGQYSEALTYLNKALKIREEIQDIKGLAYSCTDIGTLYLEMKDPGKSVYYLFKGLGYAKQAHSAERIKESYEAIATAYAAADNYSKAYEYRILLSDLKDSLFNADASEKMAEMTAKYENTKKQKEIESLATDKKLREAELHRQTLISRSVAGGGTLVLLLALVAIRAYTQKRKANKELGIKNERITHAYSIIEEKNKDITDSINYARNIQQAILPFENRILQSLFPLLGKREDAFFILFKPRDIVSGDFYWFSEKDDYIFLAVADCTGHGVPGAFMSMIGSATLTHAVSERNITEPGKILSEVNRKIKEALKQTENFNRDGMDISLIRFDKKDPETILFAGAMRTLYHLRTELEEIAGDKMSIGGTTDDHYQYATHKISVRKGDNLYVFSDGYADQFGGEGGKKFRTGNFKKLLLSIHDQSMDQQKESLDSSFEAWKGNLEQVDDVCVIGIKI
jgi:serine phosphatase RsbU (regulator of sigma subunit)